MDSQLPPAAKAKRSASLQYRMSESDPRLYSPQRDVAHCFLPIMREVFSRLQHRICPELEQVLEAHALPDQALGDACEALARFIAGAEEQMRERPTRPGEGYAQELERCGWFSVPAAAQMAVMATLGMVVLGWHYAGVREATLSGEGPAMDLKTLSEEGANIARFLSLPRWRRKLTYIWLRLRAVWQALRASP